MYTVTWKWELFGLRTVPVYRRFSMEYYRRLPVDGMYNVRELGGFPTADGRITRYGFFIRSEIPRKITKNGLDFLKKYGVSLSVDLRGSRETERTPSILASQPWLRYMNIPTANSQLAGGRAAKRPDRFVQWPEMYISMIDGHKDWIRRVLSAMAEHESGTIMFNCTTGKDRTGMITAMLLGLAGVPDNDIIADYCVSQVYMRPTYMELFRDMPFSNDALPDDFGPDAPFFRTAPENMGLLLEHINEEYGGIERYLTVCGVTDSEKDSLRKRLVN